MIQPMITKGPSQVKELPEVNDHIRLFDRIAPLYDWFFRLQTREYRKLIHEHIEDVGVSPGNSVLDIGCGTGAFAGAFASAGFVVAGVDGSQRMADAARRHGIACTVSDAMRQLPFPDKSFDLVTAAFVVHGLPSEGRKAIYTEAARLARRSVLLHEYSPGMAEFSSFSIPGVLERVEKSDYLAFIKYGLSELREAFEGVEVISLGKWVSWYICTPH